MLGELPVTLRQAFDDLGWDEKAAKKNLSISPSRMAAMLQGAFDKVPGELFVRMASAGIDIQYVLTGNAARQIKPDEAALLDNYRNSTPDNQAVLRKVGAALEKQIDDDGEMCA